MINTLLSLAAVVAYTIAVPVNCTMPPDLFAYCNKSFSDKELDDNLLTLYKVSDNMIDDLEKVCSKTVSKHGIVLMQYCIHI